jgi:TonB family protein
MIALIAFAAAALATDQGAGRGHPPAQRAQGDLSSVFSDRDYPAEAIRRGEQGVATFTLDVDEAGQVSACRITGSSGSAMLDETTCRIARERARFQPARDRRGRAVPDQVSSRMHWVLPEPDPDRRARANLASYVSDADYPVAAIRAGEEGTVGFVLDISPEGSVSDCRVASSSGSASLDEATCRIMRGRPRFAPARDSAGHPAADQLTARIRWVLPPPEPVDLTGFVSSADYPAEAIRRREQGRIEVHLNLSPEGNVTACEVTRANGNFLLAARTCALIRDRVEFGPEDGGAAPPNAVVDGYVDWVLPAP